MRCEMPKGVYARKNDFETRIFSREESARIIETYDKSSRTQRELARAYNVSQATIGRVLRGENSPGLQSKYFDGERIVKKQLR